MPGTPPEAEQTLEAGQAQTADRVVIGPSEEGRSDQLHGNLRLIGRAIPFAQRSGPDMAQGFGLRAFHRREVAITCRGFRLREMAESIYKPTASEVEQSPLGGLRILLPTKREPELESRSGFNGQKRNHARVFPVPRRLTALVILAVMVVDDVYVESGPLDRPGVVKDDATGLRAFRDRDA